MSKGLWTVVVFPDSGEMVRDMLFCVVFGGFILYLLRLLAHAGGGLSVRLNLIGLVETSFGMVWCFSVR